MGRTAAISGPPGLEGNPNLVIGPPGNYYVSLNVYLALNQYAGPFTNKLVREAAAYAVDKNSIVQILGGSKLATVASQPILPGNTGYIPGYNPYPDNNGNGDAAKAKALLKQAGYPNGVTIKLLYSTTLPMPRWARSCRPASSRPVSTSRSCPIDGGRLLRELSREPEHVQA